MIDALRIIAAHSPHAGAQAVQCINAIKAKSPIVQQRYNRVVEMAFDDQQADFTPDERRLIAGYLNLDDETETESRTLTARFRVTPSEMREIQLRASDQGKDVSEFLRALVWPE